MNSTIFHYSSGTKKTDLLIVKNEIRYCDEWGLGNIIYFSKEKTNFFCKMLENEIFVYQGHRLFATYELLSEPYCHRCGYPGVATENCSLHDDLYGFNKIYVMGKYSSRRKSLLEQHIISLKENKFYAKPLGYALACIASNRYEDILNAEMLVPVPLHPTEYRNRGFNQSLELAKIVGEQLNIPVSFVLMKKRVARMVGLTREERSRAVAGLYDVLPSRRKLVGNKYVVLVDDVITTGFTVSECAKVLRKYGAYKVDVLGLARTVLLTDE